MTTFTKLIVKALSKTNTLDDVLEAFDAFQARLEEIEAGLRGQATSLADEAEILLSIAKDKANEADRAARVKQRFSDLTS